MLTGAEVPTIRSCVAALLVLIGLALGREAMTLRLVAAGALVVLLLWPLVGTGVRRLLVGLGTAWVVVTCADRLFAGAHFLSDVTAGVLLGCGLAAASYAGYVGWRPPTPSTTKGPDR